MENNQLASKRVIGISYLLSLFFVVFVWGFWTRDVYALGINFSILLISGTLFFVSRLKGNNKYSSSDLAWITPLLLLSLSFFLYENPFFKPFALLTFIASFVVFYNYAWR